MPSIENSVVRELHAEVLRDLIADFAFTTFTEGETDYAMNNERAAEIIEEMPPGDYRLEPIFIKYDDGDWKIEKSCSPLRNSRRTGRWGWEIDIPTESHS